MINSDEKLLLNLIAEIQALAVALKRLGEQMAESSASREESAMMLLDFFQEKQVALIAHKIYLNSIRELEKNGKSPAKQIEHVHKLCAKKLLERYGITF